MQFESKLKRRHWFNAFLNFVPDTLIAIALAVALDGGVVGFFVAIAGIQILYFAIWLKNTAWSWFVFSAFGRKQSAALLQDHLAAREFPEPESYQHSIEGYFSDVVSDESQPVKVRVAAAAELGALGYPASQGRMQEAMRVAMAYEDALIAYKRSNTANAR